MKAVSRYRAIRIRVDVCGFYAHFRFVLLPGPQMFRGLGFAVFAEALPEPCRGDGVTRPKPRAERMARSLTLNLRRIWCLDGDAVALQLLGQCLSCEVAEWPVVGLSSARGGSQQGWWQHKRDPASASLSDLRRIGSSPAFTTIML